MQIITPEIKDRILFYLVNNCQLDRLEYYRTNELIKGSETDFGTFYAVMSQFERIGFLTELGIQETSSCFILLAETHDFALKGGFVAKEEVFEANIDKLMLEIENLKKQLGPNHLETLNKISGIASAIFGGLALHSK